MTGKVDSMSRLLSLDEIKSLELQMLSIFSEFCEAYGLTYYLCGGTLLGAIRHKGFIPWDDDIDVCMPRDDYNKFVDLYSQSGNHIYEVKSNRLHNFSGPFAKLVDIRTDVSRVYSDSDRTKHLWIDIFPVDGLPESLEEVASIYKRCNRYRSILKLTDCILGEGKSKFKAYCKYLLKPLANIYGKNRCINSIEAIASKNSYGASNYVGIVTNGLYGVGERMLKSDFEIPTMVEFEGKQYPTFSCWDVYLSGIYGDYMRLPPEEKRITHELTVIINE